MRYAQGACGVRTVKPTASAVTSSGTSVSLFASSSSTATAGAACRVRPARYSRTGGAMGRPLDFWPFSPKGGETRSSFIGPRM